MKQPNSVDKIERRRIQKSEYAKRARLKSRPILTTQRLKEALYYNPDSGIWTWLIQTARRQTKIGDEAGRTNKTHGRLEIGIDGRRYAASRLAWFYMTEEWPLYEVDYKNTNALDNRWNNLRLAIRGQNEANKGITRRNTSELKGVSWDRKRQKWKAQIGCGGRNRCLGRFDSREEAHEVYKIHLAKYHGEFARFA